MQVVSIARLRNSATNYSALLPEIGFNTRAAQRFSPILSRNVRSPLLDRRTIEHASRCGWQLLAHCATVGIGSQRISRGISSCPVNTIILGPLSSDRKSSPPTGPCMAIPLPYTTDSGVICRRMPLGPQRTEQAGHLISRSTRLT